MSNNDALVQRIVEIIRTHVNPKQGLANLKQNQNIVPGIVAIIKKAVGQNAVKLINYAPTNDVAKAITKIIQNKVKLSSPVVVAAIPPLVKGGQAPVAVQVIRQANARDVAAAITKLIQNSVRIPPPVAGAAVETLQTEPTPEHLSLIERLKRIKWPWSGFFSGKGKMPTYGPNVQPNFVEPVKTGVNNQGRNTYNQTPPMPGYVLTTRNGKTGWYRNKVPAVGPTTGPVGPTQPRNYSKMSIRELLDALRKYAEDKPSIIDALRKAFEKALRDIKYEYSKSRRARKLGDLLRLLPRNFNGRRNASTMAVNDIRETRNGRELSNLRSNLGRVPNENIRQAFEEQHRRFKRDKGREMNKGTSRTPTRRYNESNTNYYRRVRNTGSERELLELMRRRRAARVGGAGAGPVGGGNVSGGSGGGLPPPPLPPNQRQAINNAGGVNRAMNTVVNVPGGAPEVAKAAEALNESKGNTTYAIQVKGASPEAVNAVQKLGGPNNTVHVLEGLNTMSKTHATRKRKRSTRRPKKMIRPRVAELNRVINSVKKQRLISLVAHNVTKTHNIHPNDEKLKKYYKKVIKANILRTPFAKIARGAARKRVLPGLKG
jgi:hypothetical protein